MLNPGHYEGVRALHDPRLFAGIKLNRFVNGNNGWRDRKTLQIALDRQDDTDGHPINMIISLSRRSRGPPPRKKPTPLRRMFVGLF